MMYVLFAFRLTFQAFLHRSQAVPIPAQWLKFKMYIIV